MVMVSAIWLSASSLGERGAEAEPSPSLWMQKLLTNRGKKSHSCIYVSSMAWCDGSEA